MEGENAGKEGVAYFYPRRHTVERIRLKTEGHDCAVSVFLTSKCYIVRKGFIVLSLHCEFCAAYNSSFFAQFHCFLIQRSKSISQEGIAMNRALHP